MSQWLVWLNAGAVSLFGSVLSAVFCDALKTRRNRWIFWCSMVVLPMLQCVAYVLWNESVLWRIYPLVMHLPLLAVLYIMTGKLIWPGICILTAYLCCQLRRWFALLMITIFSGGVLLQDIVELLITMPLLVVLLRFVAPSMSQLSVQTIGKQFQFGVIPVLYYIFDYLTRIYTGLLSSGTSVAVEFMPFVCCVAYLAFLLSNTAQRRKHDELEQVQRSLNIQLTQAVRQIDALRQSQKLARQYRHDLRHHLQYLSACIESGQAEQAQIYIAGICEEIEKQKVQSYCENEAANLILSSFAGRARAAGITMNVSGNLPAFITVSDQDLCVLLSNALENAIHACEKQSAEGKLCSMDVQFYEREKRIFLQVTNPCAEAVHFVDGLPVSELPGHGIGVQSICAIVERYRGVYTFLVKDGRFILRLSI